MRIDMRTRGHEDTRTWSQAEDVLTGEGSGRPGPAEVKPGSLPVRLCATAKLRARAGQHRKAPPAAAATASTGAFAVSVFSKPAGLGAPCARKGCDNADT
jgi:hypothetical protein